MADTVDVRRVYDPAQPEDGQRVLVDRLWPRGLAREHATLAEWCRDVAPSAELRRWYGHDPQRFPAFRERYVAELQDADHTEALDHLRTLARRRLTLLTATRDLELSHARVLADLLR